MNMIAAVTLLLPAFAADTLTTDHLKAEYERIFGIVLVEADETSFLAPHVPSLPADHPLSGLMRENRYLFLYLLENAAEVPHDALMPIAADSVQLEREFAAHLRSDERFNRHALPIIGAYLKSRGQEVLGLPIAPGSATTGWSHLMNVAARFFYPSGVHPDGSFQGHICVGMNGFDEFEGERDLLVEAFAYAAIFRDLDESRHNIAREFSTVLHSLRRLDLPADPERKLRRAQAVAWDRMAENVVLHALLAEGYRRRQDYLPFAIIPPPSP